MSNSCPVKTLREENINEYKQLQELISAMSNKTRLAILSLLLQYEEVCTCELEESLKMQQPTLTNHILRLYHAGILTKRESWKYTYYSLVEKYKPLVKAIMDLK